MALTVVTPATDTLLTTRQRVKDELGITTTTTDTLIDDLIGDASSAIAVDCGWPFGVATYQETFKGDNAQYQHLSRVPILSVTQVLEDGIAITDYSIEDASVGALYRDVGWGRTSGQLSWGVEAYISGYILPGGNARQRYQVTYQAGYTLPASFPPGPTDPPPLPGAVQRACIVAIRDWFLTRDLDLSVSSVEVDGIRVAYKLLPIQSESLPPQAMALLTNYRKRT